MDFQSLNSFNARLNLLSGNLLPMTHNSSFPILWKIYSAVVWLLELIYTVTLIVSFFVVPKEKSLNDGVVALITTLESGLIVVRIHITRSTLLQQIIRKINKILNIEDENIKNIVIMNLKPMKTPFKLYLMCGTFAVLFWFCSSFSLVFEKNTFYYVDFRSPAVYSKEPFSINIFLLGSVIAAISNVYIFLKKVSVDVYTTHLILLVSSQYQYITSRLVLLFQNSNHQQDSSSFSENNFRVHFSLKTELKSLCQQHNTIIHTMLMLKKLLSLNIFLIYVNNVFRFCFLGIMIVKSSEITDKAFHENWYQFSLSIQRIFLMIIISNNIDIKLSLYERFNLSLPSFMSVRYMINMCMINMCYYIITLIIFC
ncbi:hypothetical protein ALC62_10234 [Cyphomyrmex costatus]|uniref:Odorant receptor n=1 Tax=Cyphomyrmex costatus TaxID=456900 RepID=A0A151IED9_9HYME|nr:hypothetical protein ALC62_10234 [Cyphomyrmex costatus]